MSRTPSVSDMFGATDVSTFFGLPAAEPAAVTAKAAIISAASATPYASVGPYCADAPAALRRWAANYSSHGHHHDFDLGFALAPVGAPPRAVDCGEVAFDPNDFAGSRDRIRAATAAILAQGAVPLLVGGDDSVPIPMIEAFADHGPITILQIDAHIDWRDEVQGERFGLSSTMRRSSELDHVTRIIQVGMRGVGSARPGDVDDALAAGVTFVPARDLHAHGVGPVIDLIEPGANVVIAFDVDAFDPSIMPAVLVGAAGGLTYWQAVELVDGVAGKARIAGFDLVEFVPAYDIGNIGALTAVRLLANVIGRVGR